MIIRSAASLGPRVKVFFKGKGRTKQAAAQETDINWIMRRYVKTGLIDHFAKHGGEYGFASAVSFHDCMNTVVKAEQMFADLPGPVRQRFNGEPAEFLSFVQNPENQEEMVKLGLARKKPEVEREAPVVPAKAESAPITPEVAGDPPADLEPDSAL